MKDLLENYSSDILVPSFLENYVGKQPKWGFNGLGYFVYKRTYSRKLDENRTEEWWQTIARCINGAQKIGAQYTKEEAEKLFDLIFNLKCNFAGRMLWQLGTSTVDRFGMNSLLNCYWVIMNEPKAFLFLFENLMLGGGVGFSVRREDVHELPRIKKNVEIVHQNTADAGFIVPDSREGWIALLEKTLNSFWVTGKSFTYSTILVRPFGKPIKGFGGTASGPEILVQGIENITKIFKEREGKKLRSIDALDICNIIGSIVVAGNVRRCLPYDSLVHCEKGLKKISEVEIGDNVLTSIGYRPIKNVFKQGKQNTIKIKTQDGYFECTPNHKMAKLISPYEYEWVTAEELKPQDRLVTTRVSIDGSNTKLPDWVYEKSKHSTTCQDIVVPELNEDVAWLIGLFHGDGYTYANRNKDGFNAYVSITLSSEQRHLAERAKSTLEKFGVTNVLIKDKNGENAILVHCQSKQLAWYFDDFIKKPKKEIRVPKFILEAKREIKLAYVSGVLDADGSGRGRPVQVVTTVYKNFALDIQNLLYSCGLESRFDDRQANGWQPIYRLNLITTYSKVKLVQNNNLETDVVIGGRNQNANSYPSEWIEHHKQELGAYSNEVINVDKFQSYEKCPVEFIPCEVISIVDGRNDVETYDIEVEEAHEFYCNGYLTHNSAEIAIGDPDDFLFLRAKNWGTGKIPNWRAMSNNTIQADSYEYIGENIWRNGYEIDKKTEMAKGEPYGFFNYRLCQEYGRIKDGPLKTSELYPVDQDECSGLNPCFRGDTLIAVADGRNAVSIKELAKQGVDVPVYSYNPKTKKVEIKWGRNPRLTGKNKELLRVNLDDGSYLDVTPNHKFLLKNGDKKEAKDLQKGDSLPRFEKRPEKVSKNNKKEYYLIHCNTINQKEDRVFEHRLISKFYHPEKWDAIYTENKNNGWHKGGLVIHHKDCNTLNNSIDNLEIMSFRDHAKLHAKFDTQREKNGRYSGVTNQQLEEFAIGLAKEKGRRFSNAEWQEFAKTKKIPHNFSSFRRNGWFKSIKELAIWASNKCGFTNNDLDPRILESFNNALKQGYNARIKNSTVEVQKICEATKRLFWTSYSNRNQSFESVKAHLSMMNKDGKMQEKRSRFLKAAFVKISLSNMQKQRKAYSDLKFQLKRKPLKKEWENYCKENKIPFGLGAKNGYQGYKELSLAGETYNHKVVSVESLNINEDVYNITVDDNHTVGIVTDVKSQVSGNKRFTGIFAPNCGEIPLANHENCNLSELYLNNIDSKEELILCAKLLYKTQKAIAAGNFLHPETNEVVHKNMRLGLGVTGVCQSLDKVEWLDDCYLALRAFDKEWSKFRGWPESIKLTTVKPSGSLSLLGGSTPGVHPSYSKYYIRRVRMAVNDPLVEICRALGYHVEYLRHFDGKEDHNTVVVSFPCETPDGTILAKEMGVTKQLELVKKMQCIWADNAVSVTAYYSPDELEDLKEWLRENYEKNVKSVSFLLRNEHGFDQAPYEEIDEKTYLKLKERVRDFDSISIGSGELIEGIECEGGACPVR